MLLQANVQKNETILVNTNNLASGLLPRWSFTSPDVREIDRILIEEQGIPGIVLMRRAAAASVQILLEQWPEAQKIRVYCGSGNNAADGFIVAGMLAAQGLRVEVIKIGDTAKLAADGQRALEYCEQSPARMVESPAADFEPDAIVDALLGTGFRGELRPAYRPSNWGCGRLRWPAISRSPGGY
jgi:NAD(P)H-hydrate epimerase